MEKDTNLTCSFFVSSEFSTATKSEDPNVQQYNELVLEYELVLLAAVA